MKNNNPLVIFTFLLVLTLTACGGSSSSGGGDDGSGATGGSTSGLTTGMITLTGVDTALVGTQLDTGFIGSSLAAAGQPDYIVIVDQASTVAFTPPNILIPSLDDPNNGFVLVVTDDTAGGIKALSMSIFVGGVKYDYACTTPVATFIECGATAITLDIGNRTVTLDDATVENKITKTVLTLAGTLTW